MTQQAKRWVTAISLAAGIFLAWPPGRAQAGDTAGSSFEQKVEQSKVKAGHLEDKLAQRSTLMMVSLVVLLGIIVAIYCIRRDKTTDKDLNE